LLVFKYFRYCFLLAWVGFGRGCAWSPCGRANVPALLLLVTLLPLPVAAMEDGELWALVDRATEFEENKQYKAAIIEWKNVLLADPDHLDGRLALGRLLLQQGDGAGAEYQLRRAAELGASVDQRVRDLTGALLMQKEYEQVLKEFSVTDKMTPPNRATLAVASGHALSALNRLEEARRSFYSALELGRSRVDAYQGLVFVSVREQRMDEALAFCQEAQQLKPQDLQLMILHAEVVRRMGDFESAALEFEAVLQRDAENAVALLGLAGARMGQQQLSAARRVLERLRVAQPHNLEQRYLRAVLAVREGRYPEASASLGDLLQRVPNHARGLMLMATVSQRMGEHEQALDRIRMLLQDDPENALALQLRASIELHQAGRSDSDGALAEALENSVENGADDPWLAATAARMALLSGHPELGAKALERALRSGTPEAEGLRKAQQAMQREQVSAALDGLELFLARPKQQRGAERIRAAMRYLRAGQWQQASVEAGGLLELMPNEALSHTLDALVYLGMGDSAAAVEILEKALELRPDFPPPLIALARIETADQQFEQARQRATVLVDAYPERPLGYALRGDVMLAQGYRDQAVVAYTRALENADSRTAVLNLSQRLVSLGGEGQVIHGVKRWVDAHPDDVELRVFLALQLQISGRKKDAVEHFRAVLDRDATEMVALNELAIWHQREQELSIAEGYAERAFSLHPGNPVVADTLGWIRLQQGREADAAPLLEKAGRELQGVPLAHYHYGVLLSRSGARQQAGEQLRLALLSKERFPGIEDALELLKEIQGESR